MILFCLPEWRMSSGKIFLPVLKFNFNFDPQNRNKSDTMKENSNNEKIAFRGILLVTLFEILAMLVFHAINM